MGTRSFFCWRPTAIVLWVFGVLFAFAALACGWGAWQAAHSRSDPFYTPTLDLIGQGQHAVRWFLHGTLANGSVAALCLLGWYLMRRRQRATLALGGFLVLMAALIIGQRSLIYLFRGACFAYWCDLVFELPFLGYAIIYACRECKKAAP